MQLPNGALLHLYTAHLHAEYSRLNDEYLAHRVLQAYDTAQFIRLTSGAAEAVVLAGDLNTEPGDLAYRLLVGAAGLRDCSEAEPTHETLGNTYTPAEGGRPKRIDYVLWSGQAVHHVQCELPLRGCRVPGTQHSYSDHEAVRASLTLRASNNMSPAPVQPPLEEAARVLSDARQALAYHRRVYAFICVLLCAVLWVVAGDVSWPFSYLGATLHLLRLLVTIGALFALAMATLWNSCESNAIRAAELSLHNDISHAQHAQHFIET